MNGLLSADASRRAPRAARALEAVGRRMGTRRHLLGCDDPETSAPDPASKREEGWAKGATRLRPRARLQILRTPPSADARTPPLLARLPGSGASSGDRSPECAQWAAAGECDANPDAMAEGCKAACATPVPPSQVKAVTAPRSLHVATYAERRTRRHLRCWHKGGSHWCFKWLKVPRNVCLLWLTGGAQVAHGAGHRSHSTVLHGAAPRQQCACRRSRRNAAPRRR